MASQVRLYLKMDIFSLICLTKGWNEVAARKIVAIKIKSVDVKNNCQVQTISPSLCVYATKINAIMEEDDGKDCRFGY